MSVYGYNRRTTPYLERLAEEGVVFENAYSNSTWTRVSTASFMTSLQNGVLGSGTGTTPYKPLPEEAVSMAEYLHGIGYQTAVFTSNPWAGSISGLERGVDLMRDTGVERDYTSSVELHRDFWEWREAYPGQPYWAHFQTTDVHEYEGGQPEPVVPFSGLFINPERRRRYYKDWERIEEWRRGHPGDRRLGGLVYSPAFAATGVDRVAFFDTMRGLYDESMAHQDYQIGRLVARLNARGEWENTLLIVAADHSVAAALWDIGAALQPELPPVWNTPMFRSTITRVPLLFIGPGLVEAGRRFTDPVSMLDVLPTVLDLVGLDVPSVLQGQSLAPLLRGESTWQPRPVILEEIDTNPRTGERFGTIEMIDGRWGASLKLPHESVQEFEELRRPWPLLLYDLWNDPLALNPLNEQYPELVEKYTKLLEKQLETHEALAVQFSQPGEESPLTPEQLRTLRSLGYIR